MGYLVASVALLHLRTRGQIALLASLLLGYWALLALVPFSGYPAGTLERDANLALHVDKAVLRTFRHDHHFTWLLSSLGFAATVLMGTLAGRLLRSLLPTGPKLLLLAAIGVTSMAAGLAWSLVLPINRHIWTSSLVLWMGGASFLVLALFYAIIDVAGAKRWAFFFIVIGTNALLAYVVSEVYGRTLSDVLVIGLAKRLPPPCDEVLRWAAAITLLWLALSYLYRQRVYLRA